MISIILQKLVCVVNVQHNCAAHQCKVAQTRRVRQEREVLSTLAPTICHDVPDDLVLNCAQMRSYAYVQQFFEPMPGENREHCIHEGAVREYEAQRDKTVKEKGASTTPAPRNRLVAHQTGINSNNIIQPLTNSPNQIFYSQNGTRFTTAGTSSPGAALNHTMASPLNPFRFINS